MGAAAVGEGRRRSANDSSGRRRAETAGGSRHGLGLGLFSTGFLFQVRARDDNGVTITCTAATEGAGDPDNTSSLYYFDGLENCSGKYAGGGNTRRATRLRWAATLGTRRMHRGLIEDFYEANPGRHGGIRVHGLMFGGHALTWDGTSAARAGPATGTGVYRVSSVHSVRGQSATRSRLDRVGRRGHNVDFPPLDEIH